ncbi:MAG: hypothetical protein JNM56_22175 [Planctomycetia bacterium]|nr:hypothetical protein [Planctomycetia bacterium]
MSKPRDATMKALLEIRPGDWLPFLGQPAVEPVTLIDADVSTVTAAGDKVIHVGGPEPWLLHLEFQSSGDDSLVRRMLQYNVLLDVRHDLPVRSVAILLHPSAHSSVPSDDYVRQLPDGQRTLEFRFGVVRVWQLPVEPVLRGGLAVLPLAPLCAVDDAALPTVIRRMDHRLREETEPATGGQLMNAAFVLAGLRLPPTALAQLFAGVVAMRESSGYQLILAEGRAEGREEGAKKVLISAGRARFGPPTAPSQALLDQIHDLETLEQLAARLEQVNSWQELLGQPAPRSRSRRKK